MKVKNSFPEEVAFMFLVESQYACWYCGVNHANCGHHIFGRGNEEGCEKSALNYAPLNNSECHLPYHGYLITDQGKKDMLTKTIQHLMGMNYVLKKIDRAFVEKYTDEIRRLINNKKLLCFINLG